VPPTENWFSLVSVTVPVVVPALSPVMAAALPVV
jgi:hypothetical protein